MAVTITVTQKASVGNRYRVAGTMSHGAGETYAAGGLTLASSALALRRALRLPSRVDFMNISSVAVDATGATANCAYVDLANAKLQYYGEDGTATDDFKEHDAIATGVRTVTFEAQGF